jgi:hypothetical protein
VGIKASFWFPFVVCEYVKTPLFETEGFFNVFEHHKIQYSMLKSSP